MNTERIPWLDEEPEPVRPEQRTATALSNLRIEMRESLLDVRTRAGGPLLMGTWASVTLADGSSYTTQDAVAESGDGALTISSPGTALRPEVVWRIESGEGTLRCRLGVRNTTPHPLPVERFDVLVAPTGYRRTPANELEVAQTGWQSWSAATPPVPLVPEVRSSPPPVVGPMLPPTEAERVIVPWMTLLHAPGGHSLLAGFTTARDQAGVLAIQPALDGHRFTASSYAEGVPLQPGAALASEELLLIFDRDDTDALDLYAGELATRMKARPWPHVTTGWCSWYYYFTRVAERDVLDNLAWLEAHRDSVPVEYVQLDDGYQTHVGDWLTLNEKFPSGMRFLTGRIRAAGFKPGIWLAPFLVSEQSEVYKQHPDWVVRDEHGLPINAIHNWDTPNYALDTTHPGVRKWLRRVIDTMVYEWGYDYLKIDFIYAAALRGKRHHPTSTGIQAYRRGVELIREAAGERFVLGCGAPFAPSVGLVDGMRVGPDTAPYWRGERDRHGSAPGLVNAIRSTLAHGWMHNRLWTNDPDCLMVRERDSQLTRTETDAWTSVIALSGGMVLVSDNLSRLEPERAAIIPRTLPPLGTAGEPLGPYVDGLPERVRLVVRRRWERWLVVGLFNWHDEPRTLAFEPAAWGLPEDLPYHLHDTWTGEHRGPLTGASDLGLVPPHGVRLLAIHADKGRPQFIGSTLHLLGGAVELADERWEGDVLTLKLECSGEREGELAVYIPSAYEYHPGDQDTYRTERRGDLLIVSLQLAGQTEMSLPFAQRGRPA